MHSVVHTFKDGLLEEQPLRLPEGPHAAYIKTRTELLNVLRPVICRDYVSCPPIAFGSAIWKTLETLLRVERYALPRSPEEIVRDFEKPNGYHTSGYAAKVAREAAAKVRYSNAAFMEQFTIELGKPGEYWARGRSTWDPTLGVTNDSRPALLNYEEVLKLNGLEVTGTSIEAYAVATLKLFSKDGPLIMVVQDPESRERRKVLMTKDEFRMLWSMQKPTLKTSERGHADRRAIWIISMPTKILALVTETAARIISDMLGGNGMTKGGPVRLYEMLSVVSDVNLMVDGKESVIINGDCTKFNECLSEPLLMEVMSVFVNGCPKKYKILALSGIRWVCNKLVLLPTVGLKYSNGATDTAVFSQVEWEQIENVGIEIERERFEEFRNEAKANQKRMQYFTGDAVSGGTFMGMGLLGQTATIVGQICFLSVSSPCRYIVGSDDYLVTITAANPKEVVNKLEATMKLCCLNPSPEKTIYYFGHTGLPKIAEFNQELIVGRFIQVIGHQTSALKLTGGSPYGAIMAMKSTAGRLIQAGGPMVGYIALAMGAEMLQPLLHTHGGKDRAGGRLEWLIDHNWYGISFLHGAPLPYGLTNIAAELFHLSHVKGILSEEKLLQCLSIEHTGHELEGPGKRVHPDNAFTQTAYSVQTAGSQNPSKYRQNEFQLNLSRKRAAERIVNALATINPTTLVERSQNETVVNSFKNGIRRWIARLEKYPGYEKEMEEMMNALLEMDGWVREPARPHTKSHMSHNSKKFKGTHSGFVFL